MRFGLTPIAEALGGVIAHTVRQGDLILKKGVVVGDTEIALMRRHGVSEVVVALREAGDLGEDEAALAIAQAAAGGGVAIEPPATGRSNLFAEAAGVLVVDRAAIDRVNAIDEAITIATLAPMKRVTAGEMVATVKIIPFAVPGALAREAAEAARGAVRVSSFRALKAGLISTLLPGLKASVVDKTRDVLASRLKALGDSVIAAEARVPHETAALAGAIREMSASGVDLLIIFGASAITDRRDVVPAALEAAGGRIEHLGMPVDPGNLLLIGEAGGAPAVGAPGCARSPRENGFDWVLERLVAGVPVARADIQAMGPGGLLMEIVSRPQPRSAQEMAARAQVAAVILAAGQSTRMGSNKLLETVAGKPVVRHVAEAVLASRAGPALVVLGHEAARVRAALAGLDVIFIENPRYAEGMSTSLRAGVGAVPTSSVGALVVLGDMPQLTAAIINRIIDGFVAGPQDALAAAPVAGGRRGNPVLIARALLPAVEGLTGDMGARGLLNAASEGVVEVTIDEDAVLLDVDTPQALAQARAAMD